MTTYHDPAARLAEFPQLMTTFEAAAFLSLSKEQLQIYRKERSGPPFLHIGQRTIRYDRDDLLAWARSHRVSPIAA